MISKFTSRIINQEIKFALFRIFNAGCVLITSYYAALIIGPQGWGDVSIFQTLVIYASVFMLGLPEGYGQLQARSEDILCDTYKRILLICLYLSLTVFFLVCLYFIFLNDRSNDKNNIAYIFPFALFSLLVFALERFRLRGLGNFKSLSSVYKVNAFSLLTSVIIISLFPSANTFLILFYLAYFISVLFSCTNNKPFAKKKMKSCDDNFKSASSLIKLGFPIVLSGIVFEAIISLDRFYILLKFSKEDVGLSGLSFMLIKGHIMLLSIVNTLNFQKIAQMYEHGEHLGLMKNVKKQACLGLAITVGSALFIYLTIQSDLFIDMFPRYSKLYLVFAYQSLILLPLCFIFPLSIASNFNFGGKLYLKINILILCVYFITLFLLTLSLDTLDYKKLYVIVSIIFTFSALYLYSKNREYYKCKNVT